MPVREEFGGAERVGVGPDLARRLRAPDPVLHRLTGRADEPLPEPLGQVRVVLGLAWTPAFRSIKEGLPASR